MSNIDENTVKDAVDTIIQIQNGNDTHSEVAYKDAMKKGLNKHQKEVVKKYVDKDSSIKVDSYRAPNFLKQLAENTRMPITFVLDNVEFVVKTSRSTTSDIANRQYFWNDDGYHFQFYTHDDYAEIYFRKN